VATPLKALLAVLVLLLGLFAPAVHELGHTVSDEEHGSSAQTTGAECAGCVAVQALGHQVGLVDAATPAPGDQPAAGPSLHTAETPSLRTRSTTCAPRAPPAA
jgi:hypothetical protein